MNPNKQSACHVMSKYAITRAGRISGCNMHVARVRMARRRCTSVHGSAGAFTKRRQPVRFVITACRRADGACVRVPAPRPSPETRRYQEIVGWVSRLWLRSGKIRIGRDGDFFPDF